jgi:hypothetical protein
MAVIAPLIPQIGVTDVPRRHNFYCQVLGFASNWEHEKAGAMVVAELQLDPAKLQIAAHDGVRDNDEQRSACRASIFFSKPMISPRCMPTFCAAAAGRQRCKWSPIGCAWKCSAFPIPATIHCG